jgi:sucrose phosphorylase
VTVLDTHDGIGMVDVGPADGRDGLLSPAQIDAVVDRIGANSDGTSAASRLRSGVYQVSCTAYDAVGRDDADYLLARLLQLFTPGVPQVYYVGLLAGRNVPFTGDAREINRRRYTAEEVDEAVQQPVVEALLRLIRLRTHHPAFAGQFALPEVPAGELALQWRHGEATAELRVVLTRAGRRASWRVSFSGDREPTTFTDADMPAS